MNAAAKTTGAEVTDRELALELGSLMLFCLGRRGNDVLRVIDESGLTLVQMKAVIAISSHELPEETTVTALSETLGVSPASASRAVDGLVKRKLASRVEDAEDRRVRRVALTAKGHELADRIISARLAGLEDFTASLDEGERRKLAVALEALMQREEIAEVYRGNQERFGR